MLIKSYVIHKYVCSVYNSALIYVTVVQFKL